jgi:hypothetical protein
MGQVDVRITGTAKAASSQLSNTAHDIDRQYAVDNNENKL